MEINVIYQYGIDLVQITKPVERISCEIKN